MTMHQVVPEGSPDCLAGLVFVLSGVFDSLESVYDWIVGIMFIHKILDKRVRIGRI